MILNAYAMMHATGCRLCKAEAGSPCVKKGRPRSKLHRERVIDADRLRHGKPALPQKPPRETVRQRTQSAKDFYASWEWKEARYEALRRHGRQCQCCGWKPGSSQGNWLVVDHIKPRALFPDLRLSQDNLQVLCNDCNMGKGRRSDDFRKLQPCKADLQSCKPTEIAVENLLCGGTIGE
jgi:5-methylcytosine-specific restriction endonuclease McrA